MLSTSNTKEEDVNNKKETVTVLNVEIDSANAINGCHSVCKYGTKNLQNYF